MDKTKFTAVCHCQIHPKFEKSLSNNSEIAHDVWAKMYDSSVTTDCVLNFA